MQQFEDSFTRQVEALRAQQEAAQQQLLSDMAARRPQRPKPSGEYLQQRRIQEAAARLGEFTLAHQAKQAADAMYGAGWCMQGCAAGSSCACVMGQGCMQRLNGVGSSSWQLAVLKRCMHGVQIACSCCRAALLPAEFDQTTAMWEADVRLRQAKLAARQQMEGEGLLQRGGRARDELELRRGEEVARQANRCARWPGMQLLGAELPHGAAT